MAKKQQKNLEVLCQLQAARIPFSFHVLCLYTHSIVEALHGAFCHHYQYSSTGSVFKNRFRGAKLKIEPDKIQTWKKPKNSTENKNDLVFLSLCQIKEIKK